MNLVEFVTENWKQLGLTETGKDYILEVIQSPPSREPRNNTGRNVVVDFASRKMGETRPAESETVEAAVIQCLEVDDTCLGYYSQPKAVAVQSVGRDGVSRKLWLTFDFLAIFGDRIEIIECKTEADAIKLSSSFPGRFQRDESGHWVGPEVTESLRVYGIQFRIILREDMPVTMLDPSDRSALLHDALEGEKYFHHRNEGEAVFLKTLGFVPQNAEVAHTKSIVRPFTRKPHKDKVGDASLSPQRKAAA